MYLTSLPDVRPRTPNPSARISLANDRVLEMEILVQGCIIMYSSLLAFAVMSLREGRRWLEKAV